MGTLVVKQWMSLDGVVESESMGTWFAPFHSDARGQKITADPWRCHRSNPTRCRCRSSRSP